MSTRTDAIKAAIDATTPDELQWLPNHGHEPAIPEGWEFWGVRLARLRALAFYISIGCWEWSSDDGDSITHYAIRRKPTQFSEPQGVRAQPTLDQALEQLRIEAERLQQPSPTPTLSEVTPVTEDAHELRKRAVLEYVRYSPIHWVSVSDIASAVRESIRDTIRAIESLRDDGQIEYDAESFRVAFRSQSTLEPIRKQSGALVISGRLTSVGERFAGIESGDQQITLSINTEQARWLGRYVGGQIKLTVEVVL